MTTWRRTLGLPVGLVSIAWAIISLQLGAHHGRKATIEANADTIAFISCNAYCNAASPGLLTLKIAETAGCCPICVQNSFSTGKLQYIGYDFDDNGNPVENRCCVTGWPDFLSPCRVDPK